MPGGERLVEPLRRPVPLLLAPLVVTAAISAVTAVTAVTAAVATRQALDEPGVAHSGPQVAGVVQQRVGAVHRGDRRVRMQGANVIGVAAENPLFHRLGAEHVVRHQQIALAGQKGVVFGEHAGELVPAAGGGLTSQQGVQDGHEVRLAGPE